MVRQMLNSGVTMEMTGKIATARAVVSRSFLPGNCRRETA